MSNGAVSWGSSTSIGSAFIAVACATHTFNWLKNKLKKWRKATTTVAAAAEKVENKFQVLYTNEVSSMYQLDGLKYTTKANSNASEMTESW